MFDNTFGEHFGESTVALAYCPAKYMQPLRMETKANIIKQSKREDRVSGVCVRNREYQSLV